MACCVHYEHGKEFREESGKDIVDVTTSIRPSTFPPGILLEKNFVNVVDEIANVVSPPPGLPSPFEVAPGPATDIASDASTPFDFAMPPILISPFACLLSMPAAKYSSKPEVTHLDDGDAIITWKINFALPPDRQIVSPIFTIGVSTFKLIVLPVIGKPRNKQIKTSKSDASAMLKACNDAPVTTLYKIWCGDMADEDKCPFAVNNFTVHAITPPTQSFKLHKPDKADDVSLFCRIASLKY